MKKTLSLFVVTLMLPLLVMAQDAWNTTYKEIEARIIAPTFKEKIYKPAIKTFNTAAKNQKAINKAIQKASKNGGGKVVIPAGKYMTGAITLLSNVNLVVEKNAELIFAFDRDLYPNVETRWEGLNIINYQPCIYAVDAQNIGITGEGIINGNAIAVFTAMGMCWSGYLSTHTAMLDSLGFRSLTSKAILAHTVGGLVAGVAAHWLYVLFSLIF